VARYYFFLGRSVAKKPILFKGVAALHALNLFVQCH
jgi:hypothetical protein